MQRVGERGGERGIESEKRASIRKTELVREERRKGKAVRKETVHDYMRRTRSNDETCRIGVGSSDSKQTLVN